jgi:hypothetical protein
MKDNKQPMAAITTRIYGMACNNSECDMYQGLVFGGILCNKCGYLLRKASVHASCLQWEENPKTCNDCISKTWEGYCTKNATTKESGYPRAILVCNEFMAK